jgi:DNA polymerase-3 subunit gamma/tau
MAEHYRALTRKYRPRTFDDIVSQNHVSGTLKNAIDNGRLSHAYMFCGPRGVGKTTMARVLARTINQIDDTVDGEHLNQTLNVVEIDAASNNKVEDVHHLRESVRIPPQNGRYKVFIVDEVHMLSKAAFNALLKTLEEPPDHAIFIFATTEPHKVLPTILSRVQRFDFKRIKVDEIVERLKRICADEQINIDEESLHVIAKKADGALRDALGLMDQAIAFCGTDITHEALLKALNVVSAERLFQFMETVQQEDAANGLQLVNDLLQEGYDIQEFLVELTEHLRNLYVAVTANKMHLIEASEEMKKRYRSVADQYSEEDLMRMLHLVNEAQYKIREAHQPKLQLELTLLKLIHMKRAKKLDHLLREMQALKKNAKNGVLKTEMPEVAEKSTSSQPAESESSKPEPTTAQETVASDSTETVPDQEVTSAADPEPQTDPEPEPEPDAESKPKTDSVQPHTESPAATSEVTPEEPPQEQETELDQAPEQPTQESPSVESDTVQSESAEPPVEEPEPAQTSEPEPEPQTTPAASEPGESRKTGADSKKDDDYDFFGRPSLGNGSLNGHHSNGNGTGAETKTEDTVTAARTSEPDEPKESAQSSAPLQFSIVRAKWSDFVEQTKGDVPQMLYFQLQRVSPLDLKKDTLVIKCGDHFARTMLEDNRLELSRLVSRYFGHNLRLESLVQEQKKEKTETMSPYERFKQLQQKDPTIRSLVELFGAELEY